MASTVIDVNGNVVRDVKLDYATQRQATVNVKQTFTVTNVIVISCLLPLPKH